MYVRVGAACEGASYPEGRGGVGAGAGKGGEMPVKGSCSAHLVRASKLLRLCVVVGKAVHRCAPRGHQGRDSSFRGGFNGLEILFQVLRICEM